MHDLESIYADIKNKINQLPNEPAIIYTGVGTAAGLRNEKGLLELTNYHQYPPFLQDLKNNHPYLNLYLVLIDPCQENPPYMVQDKNLILVDEFKNTLNHKYIDEHQKIAVYVLRKNITSTPYIDPLKNDEENNLNEDNVNAMINITAELRDLNQFASINKNVSTIYHDFTGRRNDLIAEFFDEEINPIDLDHIIYGLSVREDHGCYFDLNSISSFMPYRLNKNNNSYRFEFFNIYKYLAENNIDAIQQDAKIYYPPYMLDMINIQSEKVLAAIKTEFKNNIFSTMRLLLKLIRGDEKSEDIKNIHIFAYVSHTKRIFIEEKFKEGNYRELFDYLIDFFSKKMEIIVKLKKIDLTGAELIRFVINEKEEDMYNWYNNLNYFIY